MPSRKRAHAEMAADDAPPPPSLLSRIRNDWRFASVMQYIHIFGSAIKIDDNVDVDMLEEELLKQPHSVKLTEIGLAMLRMVSSHRGLTQVPSTGRVPKAPGSNRLHYSPDIFDEYTRRQYVAKAPEHNPFGEDEEPAHFADMDVFGKLAVLHQLSVWTFYNPDRMRERMPEKDSQQTEWRIPPAGWDADDREYYVLDDDRLYRLTRKPLPPAPKAKAKAKKKAKSTPKRKTKAPPPRSRGSRSSKRQRLLNGVDSEAEEDEEVEDDEDADEAAAPDPNDWDEPDDNGLGGDKWELVAITLEEYQAFMSTIHKSRDPNEKTLYRYLTENSLPALERAAASRARKAAARERELAALEKMAFAKRSSRISARQQAQKDAEDREAAEKRKKEEIIEAQREMDRQAKMEEERESRMMTREQRLKDREARRILHEQEIEQLHADEAAAESREGYMSERALKAKLRKKQEALDEIKLEEEDDWYFDCAKCGVHGRNIDDGAHSMACEKCGVWQHSKCYGISEAHAESDDFHFVCDSCSRPKAIKINLSSSEPLRDPAQPAVQQSQPPPPPPTRTLVTVSPLSAPVLPHPHTNGHGALPAPVLAPPRESLLQPTGLNGAPTYPPARQVSAPTAQTPQYHAPHGSFPRPLQATPTRGYEHGSSPAPSLSATQGTRIRFSPTPNQSNLAGSHAYTPTSNRPSAAAYSPTKKASSSPQLAAAGPLSSPPQAQYAVPAPQAHVLPSPASGLSPVKHAQPGSSPPPPPPPSDRFSMGARTSFGDAPRHGLGLVSPADVRLPPASALASLPPAPTLSPTQATPNLSVPVKKDP